MIVMKLIEQLHEITNLNLPRSISERNTVGCRYIYRYTLRF